MLQDRLTYGQVYGISPERKGSGSCLPPRAFPAPTGGAARRRRGRISAAELAERNGEEPEEAYAGSRYAVQPPMSKTISATQIRPECGELRNDLGADGILHSWTIC